MIIVQFRKPICQDTMPRGNDLEYSIMLLFILFIQSFLWVGQVCADDKQQVVAGAGPSTKIVSMFIDRLAKTKIGKEYQFHVPQKSIKHAGGIRSTRKNIFGRTGRPLSPKEKAGGITELFLGKMSTAFVMGHKSGVKRLSVADVCGLFTGAIKNWLGVGGNDHEVVVFTREPTEAILIALQKQMPCMHQVVTTRFIFKKDHQVVKALMTHKNGAYAISFGALKNFPQANIIDVEGFAAGVNVGLVFQSENHEHPLVQAARKLVRSEAWRETLLHHNISFPDP